MDSGRKATARPRRTRIGWAARLLAAGVVTGSLASMSASLPAPAVAASGPAATPEAAPTGHEGPAHDGPGEGHHGGWIGTATEREDFVVTTAQTARGLAVVVSERDHGWAAQTVATIQPHGYDGDLMGNTCVTGTGRYAVVVVGPLYAANRPAAMDRGGAAYRVDLRDGTVRPLVDGVTLYYHNPGCGTTDRAVFTRYLGVDQQRTEVYEADLTQGSVRRVWDQPGQLTSAVPVEGGFAAVEGGTVVTRSGRDERRREPTGGDAFELRPNAAGGVDYHVFHGDGRPSEIRRLGEREPLATGRADALELHTGRRGRNIVAGAEHVRPGADVAVAPRADHGATVSLDAGVAIRTRPDRADSVDTTFDIASTGTGEASATFTIAGQNGPSGTVQTEAPPPAKVIGASGREGAPPGAEANTTTPKCAVPRNDPDLQVRQPSPQQVWWAVNEAAAGRLTALRPGRAKGITRSFAPSIDFPRPNLAGNPGKAVPPSLAASVFAQESALRQASTKALPGVASEPLIANYYGDNGNLEILDFDHEKVDCGYGVAQNTSWMSANSVMTGPWTNDKQFAVGVDYAENIAAGIWALGDKWNQAWNVNLKINDGNSDDPISWYYALWAYNSGMYASDQTKVKITDGVNGDGKLPHGLGWTNNPRNADYPPNRKPFLQDRWEDAREPGKWPYQERVLGFVSYPRFDYTPWSCPRGVLSECTPVPMPPVDTFCVPSVNKCDPNHVPSNPELSYCTRADRACFWYLPVTVPTDGARLAPPANSSAEPPWANNYPPNCRLDGSKDELDPPASGTVIVDNLPGKQSLRCDNSGWSTQGTFTVEHATNAAGVPLARLDWHQLGVGWGGHIWLSKNRSDASGRNAALVNKATWRPPAGMSGAKEVLVHIPDNGASTANAQYKVYPTDAGPPVSVPVNQHMHQNKWISLGKWVFGNGARVELTNVTGETDYTANVAYDAVAFVPATLGCATAGNDADGDHLSDTVEAARGLNPNNPDTDGDGLPDAWEVDPLVPGAGIYLPGNPCKVANRDDVFGPYGRRSSLNKWGEVVGQDARYNSPPDPRHKDVFVEVDWLSCNQENSGCPELGLGPGDPLGERVNVNMQIDTAYHLPPRAAIEDVIRAYASTTKVSSPDGRTGVNLHVLIDEKIEHRPNCDQAPATARGERFGDSAQRERRDVLAAKSVAVRYLWSGHSTADDRGNLCPMPTARSLLFHDPVPVYDWTPYGSTNLNGRDILLSMSLSWWCQTNSTAAISPLGLKVNACVNTIGSPVQSDGVYPAQFQVPRDKIDGPVDVRDVAHAKARLLGVDEASGTRQIWGRAIMRLLGVALGLGTATVGNDPQVLPPPRGAGLRPDDYASWVGARFAPTAGDGTPVSNLAQPPDSLTTQVRDLDGDGVIEKDDNCPGVLNADQRNSDIDDMGDACDADADGDNVPERADPMTAIGWERAGAASGREAVDLDPFPGDTDNDGIPNATDPDDDGDGIADVNDRCPAVASTNQADTDSDGKGDACDPDDDNDGFSDLREKHAGSKPTVAASRPEFLGGTASGVAVCADRLDNDGDGTIDTADRGCTDSDGDTMPDESDNCPTTPNYGWRDVDGNGKGDVCDGVRIKDVRPAGVDAMSSGNRTTVLWTAARPGVVSVRLGGTSCSNGTDIWSGLYSPRLDHGHDSATLLPVTTELPAANLVQGENTVRVCWWDGGVEVSEDSVTFTKDALGLASAGGGYHSIAPTNIVDSRYGVAFGSPWTAGMTRTVKVTGVGGVPSTGVSAVVLNVSSFNGSASSDMTLKPAGAGTGNWPKVQWTAGQQLASSSTVKVGANGEIALTNRAGTVDMVVDILGWFDDGTVAAPMTYTPLSPVRIVDSTSGTGGYATRWGPNTTRDIQVRGVGGVPDDADSVVVSLTAGGAAYGSALSLHASGEPRPPKVWNLYAEPTESRINPVTVRIGSNGKISIYNWIGEVDVFVDLVGYYSSRPSGSYFRPVTPVRVLDTAAGVGGGAFTPLETRAVTVAGTGGIPATAKGVVVNVSVSGATAASFLQLFPAGQPSPSTWDLCFGSARPVSNQTVVKVGAGGRISVTNWAGDVQIAVDVIGWYG